MPDNQPSTATGVRTSRPTILVGDAENPALMQGLLKLVVSESVHGLFHAEATFGNWGKKGNSIDFLYFDRATLDFGKKITVKIDTDVIFDGWISAIEAEFCEGDSPKITVLLEDKLGDMRIRRRTRSFENLDDLVVMGQIASDYGLSAAIDVQGPKYDVITQVNLSDLAFLRERARALGADTWVNGTQLYVTSRTGRNGDAVQLNYGNQLSEVRVTADLAGQRTSVTVSGWDVAAKETLVHEANDSVITNELNGDTSSVSILKGKEIERKESLAHAVPLNAAEAQTEAESWMRMTARRFVTARGLAQGNAKLRVGTHVQLGNIGTMFSGKYYLTEVSHQFDNTAGYLTHFTGERPGIGGAANA